jgi:pimeloyl-ACP methyl ester carboxylesterase
MTAFSRRFFVTRAISGVCFSAVQPIAGVVAQPAAHVRVELFRGAGNVFSRGMDTLAQTINRNGYSARVHAHGAWRSTVGQIAERHARGQRDVVILIGHSLGGNAALLAADELNQQNIPVALIVTFDATRPRPVPRHVLRLFNFYQNNGFGRRIDPGPGFRGDLNNVDLTADRSFNHWTIDESPRLHRKVMRQIVYVENKRPA